MMRPLAALCFAGLLACNSTATAPAAAKASPAASGCSERVAAMRTLFAHGPGDGLINLPPGMQLPTTTGGQQVVDGIPVFVLASGGFKLDEQVHPTTAELRTALDAELDKARQLSEHTGAPFRSSLLLVVDARVPASTILELADGLPPEVTLFQVVQLAGDTAPPAPPTPPAVQRIFAEPRADQRATELAKALQTAIGSCKPVTALFQKLAGIDPATRGKTLLDDLPGAVEACNCEAIDLEVLVPAVWQMAGKTSPGKRQLLLALSRDPAAEQVRQPATATAADLARLVGARGTTPFRLELEE